MAPAEPEAELVGEDARPDDRGRGDPRGLVESPAEEVLGRMEVVGVELHDRGEPEPDVDEEVEGDREVLAARAAEQRTEARRGEDTEQEDQGVVRRPQRRQGIAHDEQGKDDPQDAGEADGPDAVVESIPLVGCRRERRHRVHAARPGCGSFNQCPRSRARIASRRLTSGVNTSTSSSRSGSGSAATQLRPASGVDPSTRAACA